MPVAVPEFQLLLTQLAADLGVKVERLLSRIDRLDQREALAFLTEAYPALAMPYLDLAAQTTATFYADQPVGPQPPGQEFVPDVPTDLVPADRLAASARWALLQAKPIPALQGSAMRAVFDGSRDTIIHNVDREKGARWARHASANACAFCRMLATRRAVYTSEAAATRVVGRGVDLTEADRRAIHGGLMTRDEALDRRAVYRNARQAAAAGKSVGNTRASIGRTRGTRPLGEKYHDHCHCVAVCVRPGDTYEPPAYVEQWEQDYMAAVRGAAKDGQTKGEYGAIDITAVVGRMEAIERERTAASVPAARTRPAGPAKDAAPAPKTGTDGPRGPKDPGGGGHTGLADPGDTPDPKDIAAWLDAEDAHRAAVEYWRRVDAEDLHSMPAPAAKPVTPMERAARELDEAIASGDDDRVERAAIALENLEDAERKAAQRKERRRERDRARRSAKVNAQSDEILAKIDQGYDPAEAEAEVTGKSVESIRRRDFTRMARLEGLPGDNFEQLLSSAFHKHISELAIEAENATNGFMLSARYDGKVNPKNLWYVSDKKAREMMSGDMAAWFDEHGGRITRQIFKKMVLSGQYSLRRYTATGEDFLQ
ncbi:hypothetical protein [Mycobacterium aquaticum]|uniref:Capsid maturation protease n=1 Tax=Mycobacterium aquaticum TaxID=1927124 RepID=A0A1X0A022_9MYCO|nr:hypothetical protein [Mycobacterium aquaticum]ORA23409.1 hypothetical protein BST13_35235 [Mycobacterium aquaticum]